jgi:hypothetical protein
VKAKILRAGRAATVADTAEGVQGTGGRLRRVIWTGPVVFLVHDLEELATVEGWTRLHGDRLPEAFRLLLPITMVEFGVAATALLLVFIAAACLADRARREGGRAVDFFVLLVAVVGTNALGHVAQAILFGAYVPGLFTAVLLGLPYACWGLATVARSGSHGVGWLAGAVGVAAVVQGPVATLALVLGKSLV